MTERMQVRTLDELVARAQGLRGSGRVLLGIAGAPGAGKTHLAEALVRALGPGAVHVPMDGFHLGDAVLRQEGTLGAKGAPHTFDPLGYAALLERLRRQPQQTVYAPAFTRDLEQPLAAAIAVYPEHDVVVSEGNYLLLDDDPWRKVRRHFDAVWFASTDQQLRLERIVARHIAFGKSPTAAEQWVQSVDEGNAALIAPSARYADLVLDLTHLTA